MRPRNKFYEFIWSILRPIFSLLHPLRVEGLENVPQEGPVLLCPNHSSAIDPILLVIALVLFINHTKTGMAMRAVSRDFDTARLMGIKVNNIISVTFIIGSFLAGVGSILYFSNYGQVSPTIGAMPGLKAFVAAVFGGIGSIPGAVLGAYIIGICESLIKANDAIAIFSNAFTFALLILVLLFKPNGMFGEKLAEKV